MPNNYTCYYFCFDSICFSLKAPLAFLFYVNDAIGRDNTQYCCWLDNISSYSLFFFFDPNYGSFQIDMKSRIINKHTLDFETQLSLVSFLNPVTPLINALRRASFLGTEMSFSERQSKLIDHESMDCSLENFVVKSLRHQNQNFNDRCPNWLLSFYVSIKNQKLSLASKIPKQLIPCY